MKGRRPDPADLLLPDFGVVSYLFRDAALDAAEAWCLEGQPIAVGTVTAAGGMGKTRFSLELAKRMTNRHAWVAGEVGDLAADTGRLAALPLPRLLLIDYAESRPPEALSRLIEQLRARATDMAPARVVLVVRERAGRVGAANATITALRTTATAPLRHLLSEREDHTRAVEVLEPDQREVLYETAVHNFAAAWQTTTPSRRPKLNHADYQQPLAVLYEALDAVLGDDPGWSVPDPDDPFWGPDPVYRVLAHEEKYWRDTAPPGEDRALLRACVAVATLAGASTDDEADALLATLPPLEGEGLTGRRAALRLWLAALYRGPELLNPLRPDRLGEALVRVGLLAEYGVEEVTRVLETSSTQQLARAFTVLTRCLAQSGEAAQLVVEVLKRSHVNLADRAQQRDPAVVRAFGLILTSSAAEPLRQAMSSVTEQQQLAHTLRSVGRLAADIYDYLLAQSLHASAVALHVHIAASNPRPEYVSELASARNDLAGAYQSAGDLGRAIPLYEQTLTDSERVLGPDHPDTLTSRNNLAGAYRAAGDLGPSTPCPNQTRPE